jgi:hypothetical protein
LAKGTLLVLISNTLKLLESVLNRQRVASVYEMKMQDPLKETFFSMPFTMDWKNMALLFDHLPPPVYIKDGVLYGSAVPSIPIADALCQLAYECATTIWSHRVLYDLLTAENERQLNSNSQCPLYENCEKKTELGDEYTCKMAPWEIIKGRSQASCEYGMAATSFGLWQNTLDIKW